MHGVLYMLGKTGMRNGGICSMNEKGGAGVKIPRFMLAAPNSGSGKTLITCGLLQALKNRGLQPASFKCGPDYIDPLFHTKVSGCAIPESGHIFYRA